MKVLLIGGTGTISNEVTKKSIETGYSVYIMNRGRSNRGIDEKVKIIKADVRKESIADLKSKLNNIVFDVVIDFISYNLDEMKKTLQFITCKQYIFISSATVYTPKNNFDKYKETDDKNNKEWIYCINKIQCEKYLKEKAFEDKNFIYTIVRPYVTYDERRIPYQMVPGVDYYTIIDRILKDLPIVVCGDNIKCTVTSSKDFAIGIVGLFQNKKAFNEDFHITADKYTTWKNIIELLANKLNKKAFLIEIPIEYMKGLNSNNTNIDIKQVLADKSRNMIFDNTKIKEAVSEFSNCSSIEDNIKEILDYHLNSNIKKINYLWNGCLDRMIFDYNQRKIKSDIYNINNIKDSLYYKIGRNSVLYMVYKNIYSLLKKGYKFYKQIRGRQ